MTNRERSTPEHRFSRTAAISVVVANMIGTGVFTSLGFQLVDIKSVFVLMLLWLVGGIAALCGALTYAELGANLPRSGGEYNFLTRIYHPAAGFISGWIAITVGFAAPIALAAMTFGAYLSASIDGVSPVLSASILVIALTVMHCRQLTIISALADIELFSWRQHWTAIGLIPAGGTAWHGTASRKCSC